MNLYHKPSVLYKSSKTLLKKYSIHNSQAGLRNSRKQLSQKQTFKSVKKEFQNLRLSLKKIVEINIQKALKIPQFQVRQP